MSEHASLKQRIRQGDIVIGVSVPIDIEQNRLEAILGQDTYDFVSVDSQHSPYSEERLGSGRTAHSATVFLKRMFTNDAFSTGWTTGKQHAHLSRKPLDIVAVQLLFMSSGSFSATGSHFAIG